MIWSSPLYNASGFNLYILSFALDISSQKMVERALGYTFQEPAVSACWALQKCVEYVIDEAKSKCRRANSMSKYVTFMTVAAAS
jgi:hypothetical protein